MADDLSALFNKASISNDEYKMYENYLYECGYDENQIKYIIDTAYNLLDQYPGIYTTRKAINKAIEIMVTTYYQQRGGRLKHSKRSKVSRNRQTNKQTHINKRSTKRTMKK